MLIADPEIHSVPALVVGDLRRPAIGRAFAATLLCALTFVAFAWASKELPFLSDRAPWQNDPYDAVVSFTLFFVPLALIPLLLRASLCQRDSPLPMARLVGVLRASRVVLGAVLVTLAADWLSVILRADQARWTRETAILVVSLAVTSLIAAHAAAVVHGAGTATDGWESAPGPDALADVLTLGRRWGARLGPLRWPAVAMMRGLEVHIAPTIRRYPLTTAALGSATFGVSIGLLTAREEGVAPLLGLVFAVATCGMFAFLAAGGAYLGLITRTQPLVGTHRRLADAAVLAAASVPIALGFRSWLWWLVGATDATAGLTELVRLVLVAAVTTFALVLGVEAVVGVHGHPRRGT